MDIIRINNNNHDQSYSMIRHKDLPCI